MAHRNSLVRQVVHCVWRMTSCPWFVDLVLFFAPGISTGRMWNVHICMGILTSVWVWSSSRFPSSLWWGQARFFWSLWLLIIQCGEVSKYPSGALSMLSSCRSVHSFFVHILKGANSAWNPLLYVCVWGCVPLLPQSPLAISCWGRILHSPSVGTFASASLLGWQGPYEKRANAFGF